MLPAVSRGTYVVDVGSQRVELPIVSMSDDLALALLITVDMGIAFMERAGEELAQITRSLRRRHRRDGRHDGHPRGRGGDATPRARPVRRAAQDAEDPPGRRGQRTGPLDHHRRRAAASLRSRAHQGRGRSSASPSSTTSSRRAPRPARRFDCCAAWGRMSWRSARSSPRPDSGERRSARTRRW